jgi:hypothetical protein
VTLTSQAFQRYGIAHIDPRGLKLDAYQRIDDMKEAGRVMARKVSGANFERFPISGMPACAWQERTFAAPASPA